MVELAAPVVILSGHHASIVRLLHVRCIQPPFYIIEYYLALEIEMCSDCLFEPSRWLLDLLDHGIFHIAESHDVRVCFVEALSCWRACCRLEAGLVVVHIIAHHYGLDGY